MSTVPDTSEPRVFFDAVVHPHRSLSPRGFAILMSLLVAVSLGFGSWFLLRGAWPVFGYFGLDVLLVYWAFRQSYKSAEITERLRLTEGALTVRRVARQGQARTWTFQPNWLRVSMDDPPRHESQITLSSHGQSLVVGAFLSPDERADLAKALKAALVRWRAGDALA
jgi:uncharacterized membrane protein